MVRRSSLFSILPLALINLSAFGQLNCNAYDTPKGPYAYSNNATAQHVTGDHEWLNTMNGQCSYTGAAQAYYNTPCSVHSTAGSSSYATDNGTTVPYWHTPGYGDHQGAADNGGGNSATSDSEGATGITSCAILPCGAPSISISGAGQGGGYSVSYSPTPMWQDAKHYVNTCPGYTLPPTTSGCSIPNPPNPPYPPQYGVNYWVWNESTCSWQLVNYTSPVVIDTRNTGFKFTDPTLGNYVSFDIAGNGVLLKLSWTQQGSGNAWLVYDRDGDGVIKDGSEMFGNFTPHSDADVPDYPVNSRNGFNALAWYDKPAQGGDGNLILDKRDRIWRKLRVWYDGHCAQTPDSACHSLPSELYTLESAGITSISLVWDAKMKADAVGNQFKFFTVVNPDAETTPIDSHGHSCCDLHQKSKDPRVAWDVFLKQVP
jgi:hypothetical protein